jgi:mono/diheme cytochrome c family protein
MASSGMPPGHRKQLSEEQIQALTALLDKHATTTARLSRGDLVADR